MRGLVARAIATNASLLSRGVWIGVALRGVQGDMERARARTSACACACPSHFMLLVQVAPAGTPITNTRCAS